jgi:prepilin-type N-terminal cleavage/methylation domain-containing protein
MKKGFTLIELIVVMAIIALLLLVGGTSYSSSLKRARDARRKSDLKQIQIALELYKSQNGSYPQLDWVNSKSASSPWITGVDTNYIKKLPLDPSNILAGGVAPDQAGNYIYGYRSWGDCSLLAGDYYILAARLEITNDPEAGSRTMLTPTCGWPVTPASDIYAVSNP